MKEKTGGLKDAAIIYGVVIYCKEEDLKDLRMSLDYLAKNIKKDCLKSSMSITGMSPIIIL